MADQVLDKVIFQIDGDLTPLTAKYAQAEAMAQATGARLSAKLGSGMGKQQIGQMTKDLNAYGQASDAAAQRNKNLGNSFGGLAGGTHNSTREMRALTTELARGEWGRLPITLGMIGTRMAGLGIGAIAMGALIVGVPLALTYAADKSIQSFQKLETQIRATGAASGYTLDSANIAAGQVASGTGVSRMEARDLIGASTAGGIPLGIGQGIASVAPGYANATGTTAEEAAKKLNEDFQDISKGAASLTKEWNLLTPAQLKEITTLDAQGKSYEAMQKVVVALTTRFSGLERNIGLFQSIWNKITGGAAAISDVAGTVVRAHEGTLTPSEHLAINAAGGNAQVGEGAGYQYQDNDQQNAQLRKQRADENAKNAAQGLSAQQAKLISQGTEVAASYETAADREEKYSDQAKKLGASLAALLDQYDRAKAMKDMADKLGLPVDEKTKTELENLPKQIDQVGASFRSVSGAAAAGQTSDTQKQTKALQDEARSWRMAAAAREQYLAKAKILRDYQANTENAKIDPLEAIQLRDAALANLGGKTGAQFSDPFKSGGMLGEAQFRTQQAQSLYSASSQSSSAMDLQKRLNEAQAQTRPLMLQAQASGPDAVKQVELLTQDLEKQATAQAKLNELTDANEEARKLQQSNSMLQVEVEMFDKNADQRAKKIADMQALYEVQDRYGDLSKEDQQAELDRLTQLNERHAQLETTMQRLKDDQQAWGSTIQEFGHTITSVFEEAAVGGKKAKDVMADLKKSIADMLFKMAVTQPIDAALSGLTGKATESPLGGMISSLINGGKSSPANPIASDDNNFMGSFGGAVSSAFKGLFGLAGTTQPSYAAVNSQMASMSNSYADGSNPLYNQPEFMGQSGFETGGQPTVGVPTLVGERGPELFTPGVPGYVTPSDQTRRMMQNQGHSVFVTQQINIHPDVSAIARQQVVAMLPTIRAGAVSGVNDALKRGQMNGKPS